MKKNVLFKCYTFSVNFAVPFQLYEYTLCCFVSCTGFAGTITRTAGNQVTLIAEYADVICQSTKLQRQYLGGDQIIMNVSLAPKISPLQQSYH